MSNEKDETIGMTAETIAGDLIGALMSEIRLMPDIWVKIGADEQDEILDRIRARVNDNVREAVKLISSAGRITVAGDLKRVVFADKVEAVFQLSKHDPAVLELCESQGSACLIVVSNPGQHMGGAQADPRQMALPGVGPDHEADSILEQVKRRAQKGGEAQGDAS